MRAAPERQRVYMTFGDSLNAGFGIGCGFMTLWFVIGALVFFLQILGMLAVLG